jgi:hypothetical protein
LKAAVKALNGSGEDKQHRLYLKTLPPARRVGFLRGSIDASDLRSSGQRFLQRVRGQIWRSDDLLSHDVLLTRLVGANGSEYHLEAVEVVSAGKPRLLIVFQIVDELLWPFSSPDMSVNNACKLRERQMA